MCLHVMLVYKRPCVTQKGTQEDKGMLPEDLNPVLPMCIQGQRKRNGWKRQSAQVRALGGGRWALSGKSQKGLFCAR